MKSVSRNVILDLLPAYIAGEVSEESRALVEEFAQHDEQIARLIRAGTLKLAEDTQKISPPEELEMRTMKRIRRSIRRQVLYVGIFTASILMIPLVAMQFTKEVDWSPFDFIIMGILLFGTGLTYVLIARLSNSIAYRIAVGIAALTGLLLIWVNLAVGIIGSENNPANALYFGVIATGIIGATLARFRSMGMMRTMFAMASAQLLVPVIAFIAWRPTMFETPGLLGVLILNGFFAMLFVVSGLLFRYASERPS